MLSFPKTRLLEFIQTEPPKWLCCFPRTVQIVKRWQINGHKRAAQKKHLKWASFSFWTKNAKWRNRQPMSCLCIIIVDPMNFPSHSWRKGVDSGFSHFFFFFKKPAIFFKKENYSTSSRWNEPKICIMYANSKRPVHHCAGPVIHQIIWLAKQTKKKSKLIHLKIIELLLFLKELHA